MVSEQQLSRLIIADKDDDQVQACAAVLDELGYVGGIYADANNLSVAYDTTELLLFEADYVNPESLIAIKSQLADDVFILVLIEQCDDDRLDAYMKLGVDDFIVKPVNPFWLRKKLSLLAQSRQLLQTHQDKCRQLNEYRQQQHQEQAVVVSLYDNILRVNNLDTPVVRSAITAKSIINGDMLLVGRTPDNHLHIMLGHFLGHSISAAIAASPAAEIFFGMSAKGFEISEIAEEINYKLHKLLPGDMFMSAVIVSLRPDTKILRVLNCGFPEQILLKHNGDKSYKSFASINSPLGLQAKVELESHTCDVSGEDYLYLFSQAIVDVKNITGEEFGQQAIIDNLLGVGYDGLQQRLQEHCSCGGEGAKEAPLLELACDVESAPWKSESSEQQYKRLEALTWKTMMEFDVVTLRGLNPVPIMVNALMEIQGLQQHRQTIFMVVTELFANALDHGVLKLDSSIKSSPEGFMRFYELREQRLQTFQQGYVRLLFEHSPTETGGRLRIKVRDSGDGFDRRILTLNMENNTGFAGRGISLLKSLCSSVTFQGKGNRVTVVFDWEI